MSKMKHPFIIIGAGLAGLSCAQHLQDAGVDYLLIDQNNFVGGRVATVQEQGCRLDLGFQVLLNSYPELKGFIDLKKLDMRYFNSGCLIYTPDKMQNLANPILHPSRLLNETLSNFVDMKDKSNVISLILKSHFSCDANSKTTTLNYLKEHGFSDHFIEMFWRPFFAGVMLDDQLSVDSQFFLFLLKCFSSGAVGVPAAGMQQLPNQIYSQLDPKKVLLGHKVVEFTSSGVKSAGADAIQAAGVCISQPPKDHRTDFFAVENIYFTTTEKLDWGKWLVIVPPQFGLSINNIALMSEVAPEYVDNKKETLVSVSVLTPKFVNEQKVADELRKISGKPLEDLKFVKKISVKKALPKSFGTEKGFLKKDGVFYFGD